MKIKIEERGNLYTYVFLICFAGVGAFYGDSLGYSYPDLRVWDVVNILIVCIGIPFVFLQSKAGLPNFWQNNVSSRNRFIRPFFIGLSFGLLDVIVFKIILHPEPYQELPPFLQPFPYSIFLYVSGAFEIEVFYRLIPLTFILLLGAFYKNGRYPSYFFWAGAILTSLREPLEQLGNNALPVVIYALITGFAMNLLQAIYFKKAGFLASLTLRLGHYLLWHVLLGVYVEFYELV